MNQLEALGNRFAGVDLSYRRDRPSEWPASWRARLVTSKNERSDYRLERYGETADAAMASLMLAVEEQDRKS